MPSVCNTQSCYAECSLSCMSIMLRLVMMSVVMLFVILLIVGAPFRPEGFLELNSIKLFLLVTMFSIATLSITSLFATLGTMLC
jgi:hypothetical protein